MAPLWTRNSNTEDDTTNRGRDIGIIIACLAVMGLLLCVIARVCGFNVFGRRRQSTQTTARRDVQEQHQRPQHINPAQFMQYCARRDQMMARRELRMQAKEKYLFSAEEVDAIAPLKAADDEAMVPPAAVLLPTKGYIDVHPAEHQKHNISIVVSEPAPSSLCRSETSRSSESDSAVCSVCLEGFGPGNFMRTTPCSHIFHSHCLEQWLMRYDTRCPMCQDNLRPGTKQTTP